jgi:DNA polymerase-1
MKPVSPDQSDLFPTEMVSQRLDFVKKTKNISWLYNSKLYCINEEAELRQFVAKALASKSPKAVDTETTGLRPKEDKLVGVSVAWIDDDGMPISFYVPIISDVDFVGIDPTLTLAILKPVLEQPCIYFNFKFDYKFLKASGIDAQCLADVSLMKLLPKDGLDHEHFVGMTKASLKELFKKNFDLDMLSLGDVLGKGIFNFALAPLELGKLYAATDAFATIMLYFKLLDTTDTGFIYRLETELLPVVADMEYRGVKIDADSLRKATEVFVQENKELEEEIYALAGKRFNISSSPQLAIVLYTDLKLPISGYTTEGGTSPSTDKTALKKIKHPIIEPLLKYKSNQKLLTTFLKKLSTNLGTDGHVHTSLNSYGAISGRFSSNSPNVQQIPKAKDDAENSAVLRKAFIADEGYYLLDVDYGQIEYRVFASLCGDPSLRSAFEKGIDFHTQTASTMFGIPLDRVSDAMRHKGKTINFGLLFGMQAAGLSQQLKCTEEEAQDLLDTYFMKMPTVQPWINSEKDRIRSSGESLTIYGRKRKLPLARLHYHNREEKAKVSKALREGVNHKVQGTAGDILKISMIRLRNALKGKDMHMLLQIHDELIFLVNESIPVDEAVGLVKKCMELKLEGFVPIVADASVGYSWGNSIDYEPGMSLEDVPFKNTITVTGAPKLLAEKSDELKAIMKNRPGKSAVLLEVDGRVIEPSDVDEETGEVTNLRILGSKRQLKEIENLGLLIRY